MENVSTDLMFQLVMSDMEVSTSPKEIKSNSLKDFTTLDLFQFPSKSSTDLKTINLESTVSLTVEHPHNKSTTLFLLLAMEHLMATKSGTPRIHGDPAGEIKVTS